MARIRLTLQRPSSPSADIVLDTDPQARVGHIAAELLRVDPIRRSAVTTPTLELEHGKHSTQLDPATLLVDSGLRSGDAIRIVSAAARSTQDRDVSAILRVLDGPDAGRDYPLPPGTTSVGRSRDCGVQLTDPLVSRVHARVHVADTVEITDVGSSNGVLLGGAPIIRATLRAGDQAVIGGTRFVVELRGRGPGRSPSGSETTFNRSPLLARRYAGSTPPVPEPPDRATEPGFPLIPLVVPVLMGAVLYVVTQSFFSLVFVALSPVLMLGQWLESRISGRRSFAKASATFREALQSARQAALTAMDSERHARLQEHPSGAEVTQAMTARSPLLWSHRPDDPGWLEVRLGLGRQPSRQVLELPNRGRTTNDLWEEVLDLQHQLAEIEDVPVVADLSAGALGVAGPAAVADGVARSILAQLVGLQSPAELSVAVVSSTNNRLRWDWLKWLPHVGGTHSPLARPSLAATESVGASLVGELEELVADRTRTRDGPDASEHVPAILLVVDDDTSVERARLVSLAESGHLCGVHVLWVAPTVERLPAACHSWLEARDEGDVIVSHRRDGSAVRVAPDVLDEPVATRSARALSPVIDAGALLDESSVLPAKVSFLSLVTDPIGSSTEAVLGRWRETRSIPDPDDQQPLDTDHTLRALVGACADGPFHLDLRLHGPHALVGGTTGSGKSEFLQTWILAMAAAQSPARVTFLLVDYKGGAAFSDCVRLPHTVGLVTDLSPHLVHRALTSLRAELRYREHLLQERGKAKDLLELERRRDPMAPPSLVIVVDEFAALAKEVPEFVDGVIDVAQRGRSLGLHLVLATQRPAGVIKESLRTNTNLRVALRMNDESDSSDVVGSNVAAGFDPGVPGRGVARLGPGRLVPFQSAYVGGYTPERTPPVPVMVEPLGWDTPIRWKAPTKRATSINNPVGSTDIDLIVSTVAMAASQAGIPEPRKPWLPTLAETYDLNELPSQSEHDEERQGTALAFGMVDDPEHQAQRPVAFWPDKDGAMAVYGTGGTGKTTLLRTLASAAAQAAARGSVTLVYALDFASGALRGIEELPNVGSVIRGDDVERTTRLLDWLSAEVDVRSRQFAQVNASSLLQYRRLAKRRGEPRILLLVDGIGTFWQEYQDVRLSRTFDKFSALVLAGRAVGVHVVVTADRPNAVPSSLASSVQRRVVLRQANENDEALMRLPLGALDSQSPPGRGYVDGLEVQVAVLGGSVDTTKQAEAVSRQADALRSVGKIDAAPIRRMPEQIRLSELPALRDGEPVIGIGASDLGPASLRPEGYFLVTGPHHSGVSLAQATICCALRRAIPHVRLLHLGTNRSVLPGIVEFNESVVEPSAARDVVEAWTRIASEDREHVALILEDAPGLAASPADPCVQQLISAFRGRRRMVVASGELSEITSSYTGLVRALQADQSGLVLRPDQMDGDTVLRTPFPRVAQSDFPPGRGLLAQPGRLQQVHVALP